MNESEAKKEYITINKAVQISGLSFQTIRKLGDKKQIQCFKTPSGHRRFNKQDLEKFCDPSSLDPKVSKDTRINYIYTRVSSKKQLDDLSRQISYIQEQRSEYSSFTVISDIASGINFERKGLSTILDSCVQGIIGEVIVAHRDRLSRFGFDLVKLIIEKSGGKVTVLDDERDKSSEQELAEDLLSIIHIFSCRQMGKRSYSSKRTKELENKDESKEQSEDDN